MSADAERWAEAEHVAAGGRPRTGGWATRHPVLLVVGIAVLSLVVGSVVAFVAIRHSGGGPPHRDAGGVRGVIGNVLLALGLLAIVLGFVRLVRSGSFGAVFRVTSPLVALSRAQRRRVGRQVRGREGVTDAELAVLLPVARTRLRQARTSLSISPGPVLLFVGQVVTSTSELRQLGNGLFAVAFVVGQLFAVRDVRQVGAFVARHPEPS